MKALTIAAAIWCVSAAGPVAADTRGAKSPDAVKQLVMSMKQAGLTSVAARDPRAPDHYVAAMLFPGVQLLVIRAQTTTPTYVEAELAAGRHDAVYTALHQGVAASKLFVQDMGCDGIHGPGGLTDIVYRRGVDQHLLNGDHKAAKLSSQEYATLVAELDGDYAQLLAWLAEAAQAAVEEGVSRE